MKKFFVSKKKSFIGSATDATKFICGWYIWHNWILILFVVTSVTLRLLPRKIFPTNLFIHFYFCFVSVFKIQLRIPNSIHSTQTISCIGRSREISQGILVFRKILSRNLVRPSTKSFSFYNAGLDHPNGHPLSNTNIYLCHFKSATKIEKL